MAEFPIRSIQRSVDRSGISIVTYIVSKCGWEFLEKQEQSDYGIDGHIDEYEKAPPPRKPTDTYPTGRVFGVQVKSGKKNTKHLVKGKPQKIELERSTANYISEYGLPVFLFAVDTSGDVVYWALASDQINQQLHDSKERIFIEVLPKNVLNIKTKSDLIRAYDRYKTSPNSPLDFEVRTLPDMEEILRFRKVVEERQETDKILFPEFLNLIKQVSPNKTNDFVKIGFRRSWPKELFESPRPKLEFETAATNYVRAINVRENRYFVEELLKSHKSSISISKKLTESDIQNLVNEIESPNQTLFLFTNDYDLVRINGIHSQIHSMFDFFGYRHTLSLDKHQIHVVDSSPYGPEHPYHILLDSSKIGAYEVKQPIRIIFRTLRIEEWGGVIQEAQDYLEVEGSKIICFRILNPKAVSVIR